MTTHKEPPIIYNIFPRLYHNVKEWNSATLHAKNLGFNKIFINPIHLHGFSNSLYSVKDYYTFNPSWGNWEDFKTFVNFCKDNNMSVIIDLVINHTGIDSILIDQHRDWYVWNNNDLVHPGALENGHFVTWGDLAQINNNHPEVIAYWANLIKFFQDMGVNDFRCDAAYKVPSNTWKMLIADAKKRNPQAIFYAESLGCTNEQVENLRHCGFGYLFNSSKYWNYDGAWAIDQHNFYKTIAPTISFPESHDTERLANSGPRSKYWQKSRYLLSVIFSEGLLMPCGYEQMNSKNLHVCNSHPNDFGCNTYSIEKFITRANDLKKSHFYEEGHINNLTSFDSDVLYLEKYNNDYSKKAVLLVNKDWHNTKLIRKSHLPKQALEQNMVIFPLSGVGNTIDNCESIFLQPTEIAVFLPNS